MLSRRHGIISVDPHPTHGIRNHCHGVPSLSGAVAPCRTSSLRVVRERKPARGVGGSYISTLACRSSVGEADEVGRPVSWEGWTGDEQADGVAGSAPRNR